MIVRRVLGRDRGVSAEIECDGTRRSEVEIAGSALISNVVVCRVLVRDRGVSADVG